MEFQKPSDSLAHKTILNAVTEAKLSADALRRLFWLINAHPKLIAFVQIAQNLEQIFSCEPFNALNPLQHQWLKDVPDWKNILRWINGNHHTLSTNPDLIDFFRTPETGDKRHPMSREGMLRHGLYTSLWNRHESDAGTIGVTGFSKQYQCLQSQLLIAVMSARCMHSSLSIYETYNKESDFPDKPMLSYPSTLVLREMSHGKYSALLGKLNPETGFNSFHAHIQNLVSQHASAPGISPTVATDFIKKIASYLDRVFNDIHSSNPPSLQRKSGGGGAGGGRIRHGFVNISDHAFRLQVDPSLFGLDEDMCTFEVVYVRNDEDENERERGGESPYEDARPVLALYDISEFKGAIMRAKYAERIKTTAAQRFFWDYNQLTPTEIKCLQARLSSVWEDFLTDRRLTKKELDLVQGALIVETMLSFGQTLESARNLSIRKAESAAIGEFALLSRADSTGCKIAHGWRLPALRPAYKTQFDDRLQPFNRHMQDSFIVPDITGLGGKILYYLEKTARMHDRIFSAEPKTADQMFAAVVEEIQDKKRITQGRVSRVIGNEIIRLSGDQTLAWCVTSDMVRRNEPRMFYTAYPSEKLVAVYTQALGNLIPSFGTVASNELPPQENIGYVGARFIATFDTVKNCIQCLKQFLMVGLANTNNLQERIQYHNRYTLYTWLMQSLGTTLRAVNDPSEIIGQWNKAEAVASVTLADKEGVFQDRARLVYLGERVQSQLNHYFMHRRIFIDSIGIQRAVAKLDGEAQLLFHLDSEKQAFPVSNAWIEGQLEQLGFPLPGNFHRAFLRTELLQAGCPLQTIDAFLGHANQGESVFDAFSTFDYTDYRKYLDFHLGKIFNQLKLVPIWSKLIPH
jgi:hypothetical protein